MFVVHFFLGKRLEIKIMCLEIEVFLNVSEKNESLTENCRSYQKKVNDDCCSGGFSNDIRPVNIKLKSLTKYKN